MPSRDHEPPRDERRLEASRWGAAAPREPHWPEAGSHDEHEHEREREGRQRPARRDDLSDPSATFTQAPQEHPGRGASFPQDLHHARGAEGPGSSYGNRGGRASGSVSYDDDERRSSPAWRRDRQTQQPEPPASGRQWPEQARPASRTSAWPEPRERPESAGRSEPAPWQRASPRPGREREDDTQFDADYRQWRDEQMRLLDRDYAQWRQERYRKFAEEFSQWRSQRLKSASATEMPRPADQAAPALGEASALGPAASSHSAPPTAEPEDARDTEPSGLLGGLLGGRTERHKPRT